MKFDGIPEPLCWECVWSYLKVRERVIKCVQERNHLSTFNGIMRDLYDTIINIKENNEFESPH